MIKRKPLKKPLPVKGKGAFFVFDLILDRSQKEDINMTKHFETQDIALSKLVLHPRNVRARSEHDELSELASNIKAHGLLQPLVVAMLDDGMGFSLVPWKPVIEQRLGHSLSAVVRGNGVRWELGRSRGASIG